MNFIVCLIDNQCRLYRSAEREQKAFFEFIGITESAVMLNLTEQERNEQVDTHLRIRKHLYRL
ncbi:hypothetical protein A8C56_01420 [Niabella ginsenosidivorans]|uniref:Uncharacterized protein n=1 Tax=Niabella ginsenosidivorans TaxID=1176587 RepID=A0A1A9HYA9_9BACT|nr:hypothetical protein A8C56_01420 [Niabella ginsenosidivorans]